MTTIQKLRKNFNSISTSTISKSFIGTNSKWFGEYVRKNFENEEVLNYISEVYFDWCNEMGEEDLFENTCDFQDEFKYVYLNLYQHKLD